MTINCPAMARVTQVPRQPQAETAVEGGYSGGPSRLPGRMTSVHPCTARTRPTSRCLPRRSGIATHPPPPYTVRPDLGANGMSLPQRSSLPWVPTTHTHLLVRGPHTSAGSPSSSFTPWVVATVPCTAGVSVPPLSRPPSSAAQHNAVHHEDPTGTAAPPAKSPPHFP